MTEKRFNFLKEHYEDIESLAYCGMVFWFVPFIFAISSFSHNPNLVYNPLLSYFLIIMFVFHMGLCFCFDDDKLWRWIR